MAKAQVQPLFPELAPAEEQATPLMAQYLAQKAQNPDCLLFFRMGEFYELFFEDAVTVSKALDIVLTRRGQHLGQDIPMCGVPAHSHESYLARLIRQGFRVALCEQTEDPAAAKKRGSKSIVTREVIRIVTPGTVTEDNLLNARSANYLACIAGMGDDLAISWLDLAAGQPCTQEVSGAELGAALARIDASEILIPQRVVENPNLYEVLAPWRDRLVSQPNGRFDADNARRRIQSIYKVNELTSFGAFSRQEITALGALLDYVELTQKSDASHLARPQKNMVANTVAIDPSTRRNLELTRTLIGERAGSLLATIDHTKTGAGARLLASRLTAPLTDVAAIEKRLDAVGFLLRESGLRNALRECLAQTPDLERALARLALNRGGPRDLAAVRDAVKQAEDMRSALLKFNDQLPDELRHEMQGLGQHGELTDRLERALAAELPLMTRDGNFIAKGFALQLDELITLRDDSRSLIAGMQQSYAHRSGTPTLKIRHNNVIGYYIEVSPTNADKLLVQRELFIHRQSLASAVRFTTVELGELEQKISEAAGKALAIEMQLFAGLVEEIVKRLPELRRTAEAMAAIDAASALAELALEQNYARPKVDDSLQFKIEGGRHPVVEQALKKANDGAVFIANGCDLAPEQRLWLLTGPNMAGKSTFLRQNALIALMAQMGSFVPATSAHIGTIDRLFSRVGASDDLAAGRSTFMVEMVETAAILNQAGPRALVILDEIGRGTATYDGLSIAWATIEHLHEVNKCRTLFATHYHELTSLTSRLPALRCTTMRIKEWESVGASGAAGKEIIFLHEVIEGTADRSYGIHVAGMAGVPPAVIARAEEVLAALESKPEKGKSKDRTDGLPAFKTQAPATSVNTRLESFLNDIKPDEMSPKDALETLYALKKIHSTSGK